MAKVLGIGVAVNIKIWGEVIPFWDKLALWATPNLCCSSITTKPRFLNLMFGWIKECVPTIIFIFPLSNFSNISFLSESYVEPVSKAKFKLELEHKEVKLL